MQVYLIGMMVAAFAVGHVLPVIERGQFAAVNSACCLALSVLLSIVGVLQFGVIGAALGSVVALVVSEVWSVHIVSRALGVSVLQLHGWRALWPVIFATTTSVVGVTMLVSSASGGAFPMLLLKGLAYAALFALCFVFTGGRQSISLLTGRLSMGMVEPSGNLDEKIL
jgi:O-antigen/teichoic acid export membrane protein